jgi:hypothetical protein
VGGEYFCDEGDMQRMMCALRLDARYLPYEQPASRIGQAGIPDVCPVQLYKTLDIALFALRCLQP